MSEQKGMLPFLHLLLDSAAAGDSTADSPTFFGAEQGTPAQLPGWCCHICMVDTEQGWEISVTPLGKEKIKDEASKAGFTGGCVAAVELSPVHASGRQIPAVAAPEHPSSLGRGRKRAEGHTIVLPTPALRECRANRRELSAFLCLCCEYFH